MTYDATRAVFAWCGSERDASETHGSEYCRKYTHSIPIVPNGEYLLIGIGVPGLYAIVIEPTKLRDVRGTLAIGESMINFSAIRETSSVMPTNFPPQFLHCKSGSVKVSQYNG